MRDRTSDCLIRRVISPVSVADNTAQVGQVIDRQGFNSLMYVIATGAIADADANFAVLLEESDALDMSGAVAVADIDMNSQAPGVAPEAAAGFGFDDDNEVRKLGYVGNKRYTRLTITPAGNASAALVSVTAELGHADRRPVDQTPN